MAKPPTNFAPLPMRATEPFGDAASRAALAAQLAELGLSDAFEVPAFGLADAAPRTPLSWLDIAARSYLTAAAHRTPDARERRERLDAIEAALRVEDRKRLDRLLSSTNPGSGLPANDLVGASYEVVGERVARARKLLAEKRPSAPRGDGTRALVRDLAAIWRAGTGRAGNDFWWQADAEPVCGRARGRCGGPLADFCRLVFARLGLKVTDTSLDGHLDREKKHRARDRQSP